MNKKEDYNGYYADCYVLTENRNESFIYEFLNSFLPNREENTDTYEIPQYGKSTIEIFKSDKELIEYLTQNMNEPYAVYWRNKDTSDLTHAMCFFTNDNHLILGLSTETRFPNTEIEDTFFNQLKLFASSSEALITYEEPVPKSALEFREMIKNEVKQ